MDPILSKIFTGATGLDIVHHDPSLQAEGELDGALEGEPVLCDGHLSLAFLPAHAKARDRVKN